MGGGGGGGGGEGGELVAERLLTVGTISGFSSGTHSKLVLFPCIHLLVYVFYCSSIYLAVNNSCINSYNAQKVNKQTATFNI